MTFFIDRRRNPKNKSAVNRQRFLRRYRGQIRESVKKKLAQRSITDTTGGQSVGIPMGDTSEPFFHHGPGGRRHYVLPGNREFMPGDQLQRPRGGGGGGEGEGSPDGEGDDDFVFELSRDEFLDLLFDEMELPNLQKRQLLATDEVKRVRAGFSPEGAPGNISITRSLRSATARRIALGAGKRRQLQELESQLAALSGDSDALERELRRQIEELRGRLARIPFLDDIDLRYHRSHDEPIPSAKAVMFCLMDVSGSMDRQTKDLAKRFFILLYLFLERQYERTDVVFIRHHSRAEEVDEETFFYSRETGGTVVSTALELMAQIIERRYPPGQWNIYGSQASDGDNWPNDSWRVTEVLGELLPLVQYFAYIEICEQTPKPLWESYAPVRDANPGVFEMQNIRHARDIYPVFRELFGRSRA